MQYKTLIFILLGMLMSLQHISGQKSIRTFTGGRTLSECSKSGVSVVPANTVVIDKGTEFRVVLTTNSGYVISILKPKSVNASSPKHAKCVAMMANCEKAGVAIYFLLTAQDYQDFTRESIPLFTFTTGSTMIPIRLRFGSKDSVSRIDGSAFKRHFDPSANINLGVSAGLRIHPTRSKDFSLSFLVGIGATTIAVNSGTTNGLIKDDTNAAAFTWYTGVVAQYNDIQIGVFGGIDYLAGELGLNWNYRDQFWLGVGIGYSIYENKANKNKETQTIL